MDQDCMVASACPPLCNCERFANGVMQWRTPRKIRFNSHLCVVLGNRKQMTHLVIKDDHTEANVSGARTGSSPVRNNYVNIDFFVSNFRHLPSFF